MKKIVNIGGFIQELELVKITQHGNIYKTGERELPYVYNRNNDKGYGYANTIKQAEQYMKTATKFM